MIVRNKKTLKEYEITKADYDKLVEMKIQRSFQVISQTDTPKGKILVPKEILEFQQIPRELRIRKPLKTHENTKK